MTPRLRRGFGISLLVHAALLAGLWWAEDEAPPGMSSPPGDAFAVSLAPSRTSPPAETDAMEDAPAPDGLLTPPKVPVPEIAAPPSESPFEDVTPSPDPALLFEPPSLAGDDAGDGSGAGSGRQPGGGTGAGEGDSDAPPRFREPKLLRTYLPLELDTSRNYPSPLEVVARLKVGLDGTVVEVQALDPDLPADLRDAVERSARHMRFRPAMIGTEPVEAWKEITFVYRH